MKVNVKARVVVRSRTRDPNKRIVLNDSTFEKESFSGRDLDAFTSMNCHFKECKFENMKIEDACFGGGKIQSTYTDCSFDNSKFISFSGVNRFVRCSFCNVVMKELFGLQMEFIDCYFSGKLSKVVFYRTSSISKEYLKKDLMDFYGNDFSEADLIDVGFRGGVDLTQQRMPNRDNYIYIYDPCIIEAMKTKLLNMPENNYKQELLSTIRVIESHIKKGQKHFFIKTDDYTRDEAEKQEIINLIKSVSS